MGNAFIRGRSEQTREFVHTYPTAGGDVARGTIQQINDVYGFNHIAVDVSVNQNETFCYMNKAVVLDKKTGTGEEISKGEYVYGDPADSYKVSATKGSGFIYLGIANEDSTASETTADIDFDGTMSDVR